MLPGARVGRLLMILLAAIVVLSMLVGLLPSRGI